MAHSKHVDVCRPGSVEEWHGGIEKRRGVGEDESGQW